MGLRLVSRRRLSMTALIAAVIPLAGAMTTAQAAAPQILTFANKCVDVAGGNTADGTQIRQWTCNGTVSQNFTIVPLGDGRVTIRTFANKCADVAGGNTADGTLIREWTCNGTVSQDFTLVPLPDGRVTIRTFANKCWDVRGASTGDGAIISEWTCNNTVAQEFAA
jgi:ricin-type beta-trefoil lectin protein